MVHSYFERIMQKNHAENEAGKLVPDFFLFYKKALCNSRTLELKKNLQSSTSHTMKTNCMTL